MMTERAQVALLLAGERRAAGGHIVVVSAIICFCFCVFVLVDDVVDRFFFGGNVRHGVNPSSLG
jgi:hypothetical protein